MNQTTAPTVESLAAQMAVLSAAIASLQQRQTTHGINIPPDFKRVETRDSNGNLTGAFVWVHESRSMFDDPTVQAVGNTAGAFALFALGLGLTILTVGAASKASDELFGTNMCDPYKNAFSSTTHNHLTLPMEMGSTPA